MTDEKPKIVPHECMELPPGKTGDDIVEGSPSRRPWRVQILANRERANGFPDSSLGYPHCAGRDF